jgi:hypothetical protein
MDWRDSWRQALDLYDSLIAAEWTFIPRFREFVVMLSNSDACSGLYAYTSHEELIISPYTRWPDWNEGRCVEILPHSDGTVTVTYRSDLRKMIEKRVGNMEDLRDFVLKVTASL